MPSSNSGSSQSRRIGLGCTIAFLLPFCAVGVVTGVFAVLALGRRDLEQAGFLAIFAVTFGGVGFGLMRLAFIGAKRAEEVERRRVAHPEEPWRWRPDWESGRLESSNRATLIAASGFALFWNLVALPGAIAAMREWRESGETVLLLVLLFPLVGLGLLGWALREAARVRKFGISRFEMALLPGVIGRGLGGLVRTSVPLRPADGFQVTLKCVRRVTTGSGKNRSTREEVRWHEEATVTDFRADSDGRGTMIPVAFRLPPDVQATDDSNPRDTIVWRLQVDADVPGVDFHATFEVPVFRTEESDRPRPDVADAREPAEPFRQPPESTIVVTRSARGTQVWFPPARALGPAIGLSVFVIVWSVVLWVLFVVEAPIVFPIVFGLVEVLVLYAVLSLWFGSTRVTLSPRAITIERGMVFAPRRQTLDARSVRQVVVKIGMQSGSTPYYDLRLVTGDGRRLAAGSHIRNKREAEWLAETMRRGIGLDDVRESSNQAPSDAHG